MTQSGTNLWDRLWKLDPRAIGGVKGKAVLVLQFFSFAGSNFVSHNGLLRATALSFTSLLSLVPLLAVAFSVLTGFGAQNKLAPLVIKQMAAGSEVVVNRVITYIGNTSMTSVGAIGVAALLYTSINMLGNIEEAFNVVWGVTETRSFYRKFSDYVSVLVSAPVLIVAATSIATTMQSKTVIGWLMQRTYLADVYIFLLKLIPFLSIWVALFLLYIFIPNTRVRYKSALVGAVFAGTLWEAAQYTYIHFQVGTHNYNAIYGTLATLPILMVWLYASWVIALFGMEVVAAHQNMRTFRREIRGLQISESLRELIALATLRHIAQTFHEGAPGWRDEHLAARLGMPLPVLRETLQHLVDAGFLVRAVGTTDGYYPARELEVIPLDRVLLSLRNRGASCSIAGEEQAEEILRTADRAVCDALHGFTMKDLATSAPIPANTSTKTPAKAPPGVDKKGPDDI